MLLPYEPLELAPPPYRYKKGYVPYGHIDFLNILKTPKATLSLC